MKRQTTAARMTLLIEKLTALDDAADMPTDNNYNRNRRRLRLSEAALAYADVVRRYLGGRSTQ